MQDDGRVKHTCAHFGIGKLYELCVCNEKMASLLINYVLMV